jgi:hypothetical protein
VETLTEVLTQVAPPSVVFQMPVPSLPKARTVALPTAA